MGMSNKIRGLGYDDEIDFGITNKKALDQLQSRAPALIIHQPYHIERNMI